MSTNNATLSSTIDMPHGATYESAIYSTHQAAYNPAKCTAIVLSIYPAIISTNQ
jgi:hypothetical protein